MICPKQLHKHSRYEDMSEELTKLTGIVFDIQRTSLHDGPGIRTTVFFKGCPLRCLWCHNPESMVLEPELSFNQDKCVECLTCVQVCPHGAQQVIDGRHHFDRDACIVCGKCVPECVHGALSIVGEETTVEDVMVEVEADFDFYKYSGGGMTLSGGEPMLQVDFSMALLKAAQDKGIHTCMETCGIASQERYAKITPYVDLFLFDYKGTDPDLHREHTGVSNERILANLEFLYNKAQISLRCPLVPGVNDGFSHLQGIAELSAKYPDLEAVEIMAYHEFGRDKGPRVGREIQLESINTADDEIKNTWLETLADLGCKRVVIG